MKKRGIYLALSLAMAFSAFTACGETENGDNSSNSSTPPVHTHADSDGNFICDGCEEVLEHTCVDENNDQACDICDEEVSADLHVHKDEDGNYLCDGCEEVLEHTCVDEKDNDGACDICGDMGGHEHSFAGAWKSKEEGHYKDATCGHSVSSPIEAHTPANRLGQCSVCNYQLEAAALPEDVEGAVEMGASKHSIITSGTYTSVLTAEYGSEYSVAWQYGDNYTHVTYDSEYWDWEGWYSMLGDVLFAIQDEYESINRVSVEQAYAQMDGYGFDGDFAGYFLDGYKAFGVEGMLEYLYEEASSDWNGDFVESVEEKDGDRTYSFSYGVVGFYFYQVNVSFTLGEDLEINKVTIQSNGYEDTQFTTVEGIATLNEGATASYVYDVTIEQSTEEPEEALVNPYDVKVLLASSFEFDIKDNNNNLVEGVTFGEKMALTAKQNYKFYFTNVLPETADMTYTTVEFLIDGEPLDFFDSRMMCGFASDHTYFYINGQKAGEYNFAIIINDVEYPIELTVLPPHPTTLSPYVCVDGAADSWEKKGTATAYEGVALQFKAMGDTEAHNASFTAEVTSGEATLTIDENGVASFTASEAGVYEVTLTSAVAANLSTKLTITVVELPDMTERLNGTYEVKFMGTILMYEMVFTPAEEGAVNGTLALIEKQQDKGTATYNYAFNAGKLEVEYVEGPVFTNITVSLDGNFNVTALNTYGGAYAVSKVGAVTDVPDISGTYQVGIMQLQAPYMYKMVITPTEEGAATGTLEITDMQRSNHGTAVYNYVISGDTLTAEYVSGYENFGLTFSLNNGAIKVDNEYRTLDIAPLVEAPSVDITGSYQLKFYGTAIFDIVIDESTISVTDLQKTNYGTAVYNYTIENGVLTTEYVSGYESFKVAFSLNNEELLATYNGTGKPNATLVKA